jgi:NDP-sugar pyrophosphorylase family protein
MPVEERPILEIMIRQLVGQGFDRITITLGYLGALIMAVVGDGRRLGAVIEYVHESDPRGTIGAVRLVEELDEPFLVMNGDLLTDFDYRDFMDVHLAEGADLSVGVYQKSVPISLGVFDLGKGNRIVGFREKPTIALPCSMGIYAFDPKLLELIPRSGNFGFDDLMRVCLERDVHMRAHMFNGIWLDIGRPEDYASATHLLQEFRDRLLPDEQPMLRVAR